MLYRVEDKTLKRSSFDIEIQPNGKDERRLKISFSSETPYLRHNPDTGEGFWEVLGHGTNEVDLTRLNSGAAPLLKDHMPVLDSKIGVIERAWLGAGKGHALVRFSDTPEANTVLGLVQAGDVTCVSVGYAIAEAKEEGEKDGYRVMRVTKWTPKEISFVAIPADPSVGYGRADTEVALPLKKDTRMNTEMETRSGEAQKAVAEERKRVTEINAIGVQLDLEPSMVSDAIQKGTSREMFRQIALTYIGDRQSHDQERNTSNVTYAAVHRSGEQSYSLTRAINAQMTKDWSDAGFERECSQEMRHITGKAPNGLYVPPVALAKRDLLTTSNAASMIGTEHAGEAFIDALRPQTQVIALGATVLPMLNQDLSIPKMNAGTTAQWIAEDAEANESTPGFGDVTLSLRQLSANVRISRRQLKQSVPGLDAILRNDLLQQIAVAVDATAIDGPGSAVQPQGILQTPGIGAVAMGADGEEISWAKVTELMAAVDTTNVPMDFPGFLSNHKVKSAMLSTPKFAGGDTAILTAGENGLNIAGTTAAFTNNVPASISKGSGTGLSALIYGSWKELLIGQWGGIDIITDEMTEAAKGNVRIVAHSEWDISVRHAEAFAAITDIVTP